MNTEIQSIFLGVCTCYLIKQGGNVLVDVGQPSLEGKFTKVLKKLSINPKDIRLSFLTHGHWDHIGLLSEVKKLTNCPVAINQHD